jgi:isocitrate/isopropylmalate dehydrogenase
MSQGKYTVTLIEGDGIGPEIAQSVKDIFSAANVGSNHALPATLRKH